MNRYHFVHVTEFQYDGPVSESYNEVRLRPLHDDRQSCLSFRLSTSPATRVTAYQDAFGNWVHQFNVLSEHRHLKIEAESVVLAHDTASGLAHFPLSELQTRFCNLADDYYDFLISTAYVPTLPELVDLGKEAESQSDASIPGFAKAVSDLIHERFRYVKGATHVHSSIRDALSLSAGVCQDFAHVALGVLRARGIPARYVSGYLVPSDAAEPQSKLEQVIGGQASHAWAEYLIPGEDWFGIDPTLGAPVGMRHVRVAYGRDYGDVAPVRGVYKGEAGQRLSVEVQVCPVVDDAGHSQLSNSATGAIEPPLPSERPQQPAQQ